MSFHYSLYFGFTFNLVSQPNHQRLAIVEVLWIPSRNHILVKRAMQNHKDSSLIASTQYWFEFHYSFTFHFRLSIIDSVFCIFVWYVSFPTCYLLLALKWLNWFIHTWTFLLPELIALFEKRIKVSQQRLALVYFLQNLVLFPTLLLRQFQKLLSSGDIARQS